MKKQAILCMCLVAGGCLIGQSKVPTKAIDVGDESNLSLVLRQSSEWHWHHKGDELAVNYDGRDILSVRLGQSTDHEIPLILSIGDAGHILKWAGDFDKPELPSGERFFSLFRCDGSLVQSYKTIMWATFNLAGEKKNGAVLLALPKDDIEHWRFERIGSRSAIMTRLVDPCYERLLKHGATATEAGTWESGARNCIVYTQIDDMKNDISHHRQYNVSLPWPDINPPGAAFRPEGSGH